MDKTSSTIHIDASPEFKLFNTALYSRNARQRCDSPLQRENILQSTLLCTQKEHIKKKNDSERVKDQQVYSLSHFQDDVCSTGTPSRSEGQFSDFHRSERCLLAHSHNEIISKIPCLRSRQYQVRLQRPALWSKCSSKKLHKNSQYFNNIHSKPRNSDLCLSGRLAYCSSNVRSLSDPHKHNTQNSTGIRFSNQPLQALDRS